MHQPGRLLVFVEQVRKGYSGPKPLSDLSQRRLQGESDNMAARFGEHLSHQVQFRRARNGKTAAAIAAIIAPIAKMIAILARRFDLLPSSVAFRAASIARRAVWSCS